MSDHLIIIIILGFGLHEGQIYCPNETDHSCDYHSVAFRNKSKVESLYYRPDRCSCLKNRVNVS